MPANGLGQSNIFLRVKYFFEGELSVFEGELLDLTMRFDKKIITITFGKKIQ